MHQTTHHILHEARERLLPLGIALGVVVAMPLVGIGLLMFRGVFAVGLVVVFALAATHLALSHGRSTGLGESRNGEHTDAS